MTLSYWNQQFQFSKVLPDFHEYLQSMAARSAVVSCDFRRENYGKDPRQFVEITGKTSGQSVLPVFIHGGYWRGLTAGNHRFVLPNMKRLVGAVASLEYRLLPAVKLKAVVEDALNGLKHIHERTGCKLLVIGHSAGGHLAVTAARQLSDKIVGAIAISGLFDLKPLQWTFLREEVGLKASDLEGQIPMENWEGHKAGHITVAVGEYETPEMHRQAHLFSSSYDAKFLVVPEVHHMTVLDDLANPNGKLTSEIARMLEISTRE